MTTENFVSKFLHRIVQRYGSHSSLDLAYGYVVNVMEDAETKELHARVVWERSAKGLNENNARWYTAKFMNSVGIEVHTKMTMNDLQNPANLKNLVSRERKLIAETFANQESQQELPLEEDKEPKETVQEPESTGPKRFVVVATEQIKPVTFEEAKTLQRQAALQQPGKSFTLMEMKTHAKYPIDPLEIKA